MSEENKLLEVKVTIDDQGKLGKIVHPDCILDRAPDLPLSGEQYGWSLEGYNETGLDLEAFFAQTVDIATNAKEKSDHLNTIQIRGPELIKLDVGHWGAYHRWREYPNGPKADAESKKQGIQREFGLIENHHVWLCRFNGKAKVPATISAFEDAKARWAAEVVNNLAPDPDMGIEIIAHSEVTDPRSAKLDDQTLYVIFPDLHLPEALPDFPPDEIRYLKGHSNGSEARKVLRDLLRGAQHKPGLKWGNKVDSNEQRDIQAHLDLIHVDLGDSLPSAPIWQVKTGTYGFRKTVDFTPEQFLAEKAIVDREIMLTSTWFYARGANWNRDAQERDRAAAADDDGDPTPAIDLVHLLCAVKKARKRAGNSIQVIQVGDLYELWLNHEFLYRQFAVDTSYSVNKPSAYKAIWAKGNPQDDYQFRMDQGWQDAAANPKHPEKRYVFHIWPEIEMLRRYQIGERKHQGLDATELQKQLSIDSDTQGRLQQLLKRRVDRVRAHTLHYPVTAASIRLEGMETDVLDFYHYYRRIDDRRKIGGTEPGGGDPIDKALCFQDANGRREVFWNEMILDLFADLEFRNIGGNHDGYRADPILNAQLLPVDHAETVISEPGLWIEHSHRWDAFNRDGMAFGAGAANYVYYYFNNLCSKLAGTLEDLGGQQEQKCFVPGAALWFGIANFGANLNWTTQEKPATKEKQNIPGDVKPFGVYVSGHTHSASLARIRFEFTPRPKPSNRGMPGGEDSGLPEYGPKY